MKWKNRLQIIHERKAYYSVRIYISWLWRLITCQFNILANLTLCAIKFLLQYVGIIYKKIWVNIVVILCHALVTNYFYVDANNIYWYYHANECKNIAYNCVIFSVSSSTWTVLILYLFRITLMVQCSQISFIGFYYVLFLTQKQLLMVFLL